MSEQEFRSQLPSPDGSPFKTKNFNKFFFGILLAALLIGGVVLAYFLLGFGKHSQAHPVSSIRMPVPESQARERVRLS